MNKTNKVELYNIGLTDGKVRCDKCSRQEHGSIAEKMGWHQLGKGWLCFQCIECERDQFGGYGCE